MNIKWSFSPFNLGKIESQAGTEGPGRVVTVQRRDAEPQSGLSVKLQKQRSDCRLLFPKVPPSNPRLEYQAMWAAFCFKK